MLLDNVYLHLVNITFGLLRFLENVNRTLVFETRSGDLAVSMQKAGYLMDFPLNTPVQQVGCSFTNRWKNNLWCSLREIYRWNKELEIMINTTESLSIIHLTT